MRSGMVDKAAYVVMAGGINAKTERCSQVSASNICHSDSRISNITDLHLVYIQHKTTEHPFENILR